MSDELETIDRYYSLYEFYNNLITSAKSILLSLNKDEKEMRKLEKRFTSIKDENELAIFLSETPKDDLVYIREKAYLDSLITSKKEIIKNFKNSSCYPFSKGFHFFIEDKDKLSITCGIREESTKDLSSEHKKFCKDVILESGELIYSDYTTKDIPLIQELYQQAPIRQKTKIHRYILDNSKKK